MSESESYLIDAERYRGSFERFVALFMTWNQRINLSAARTELAVRGHVADSLHVVRYLADSPKILDVGAGGGLPGVLVAICLPGSRVVSLEPVAKKHAFLRTAARELSLSNYEPRCERLEQHPHRNYDAAVSRATWDLGEWLEMGATCIRPGGLVVGMEAVEQVALEAGDERHPYDAGDRKRAIIVRRTTA